MIQGEDSLCLHLGLGVDINESNKLDDVACSRLLSLSLSKNTSSRIFHVELMIEMFEIGVLGALTNIEYKISLDCATCIVLTRS